MKKLAGLTAPRQKRRTVLAPDPSLPKLARSISLENGVRQLSGVRQLASLPSLHGAAFCMNV